MARPLIDVMAVGQKCRNPKLKTGPRWRWDEEQQTAFDVLKDRLTTSPILAYPDFNLPFKLPVRRALELFSIRNKVG